MLQMPGWQPVAGDPSGRSGFEAVSANANLASLEASMKKKARHPNESEHPTCRPGAYPDSHCSTEAFLQ